MAFAFCDTTVSLFKNTTMKGIFKQIKVLLTKLTGPLVKQEETSLLMYKTHQLCVCVCVYIYIYRQKSGNVLTAYFTISHVVGKKKISFQDGESIK